MGRSVGRPEVGPAFTVRFPDELLGRIDAAAATAHISRASWLRGAAEERLAYPRSALATLAAWMVEEGMADQVGYALERIDKHTDLLFCAQHGISGSLVDELIEARDHALSHADVLAPGWSLQPTTPVDFRVICPHGSTMEDTEADRTQAAAPACSEGCRDRYRSELQADLTGRPHAASPAPTGAQVHQLRPGRARRRR